MKQRILSVVLALCLCLSSPLAAHAFPEESIGELDTSDNANSVPEEELSLQADVLVEEFTDEQDTGDGADPVSEEELSTQVNVLAEEFANEPVLHDSTIPTPKEVYNAMIALKDQNEYKEGTTWTNDTPYSSSNPYHWNGGTLGGYNIVARGCAAFAFILSDKAFGNLPARIVNGITFEDIKVGDILRLDGNSHTVIVLVVYPEGVMIAEGNYNGKVHWGRTITKDTVMSSISTYITRYPENYVSPEEPEAGNVIDSGTLDGGLTWELTKVGTLTISGKGAMPDFSSPDDQPWKAHSDEIWKVVIGDGVTSIGSNVFGDFKGYFAEIASSVTTIGSNAFQGSSIVSVNIPGSVKTIGDSAFQKCKNLSSVTISEGVETIGQSAFSACSSLTSIALPASLGEVGVAAFMECTEMTSATFAPGSKQVKIGDNLFTQCSKLVSVTLPSKIDRIGDGMFLNCGMLAGVEIPQGAQSIGEQAFASTGVITVIIPDSVEKIGTAAFSACPLKDIYFTGTEEQWNSIRKMGDTPSAVSKATIHYNYVPTSPDPDEGDNNGDNTENDKIFTISYVLNGGENAKGNPATYTIESSTITLENPTKAGYIFDGWYLENDYKTQVTQIEKGSTGNKTFYAKWSPQKDENGGNGSEETNKPNQPDKPDQPDKPEQSDKPNQPWKPEQSDKPNQPWKPEQSEKPNQPWKPAQSDKPNQPGNSQPGNSNTGQEAQPDTGVPFIKGENGKVGWDVIRADEENAGEGSVINVNMNGGAVVPGDIFDSIKGRNITITFDMGNGILWSVDGRSITTERVGDINFSVRTGTNAIPADIINNVTGGGYSMQLSLSHEGEFGFTAVLSINLSKKNAGRTAALYYFNQNTRALELICKERSAEDGTVRLTFTHASDYLITVDDRASSGNESVTSSTQITAPKSGDLDNGSQWWSIMAGALAVLIVISFQKKGKRQ